MALLAPRLGFKQRLYFGVTLTSSTFSGGTKVTYIKDVKVSDTVKVLDNTTRNCNGFVGNAPGLRDVKITGKYIVDDNDKSGQLGVLLNAYSDETTINVAAVDPTDKIGVCMTAMVSKAERTEANGEIVDIDFELTPHYAADIPPFDV